MGQSKGSKKVQQDLENKRNSTQAQTDAEMNRYRDMADQDRAASQDLRNRALGGFEGVQGNNAELRATLQGMLPTGGYDPNDVAKMEGDIASLRNYAGGSSVDAEARNAIRGYGKFKEAADTGLWNDAQKSDYRARAGSTGVSFFKGLEQKLASQNRAGGGYNPGYSAQRAAMSRDAARGANDANFQAENELNQSIRDNMKWGASSGSSAELGLQGLLDNIYQGSMGKVLGANQNLYGDMAAGRFRAASGIQGTNNSDLNAAEGIGGLYGSTQQNSQAYEALTARVRESGNQTDMALLEELSRRNPPTSVFDKIMRAVDAGMGVAQAIATHGKSLGSRGNTGVTGGGFDPDRAKYGF